MTAEQSGRIFQQLLFSFVDLLTIFSFLSSAGANGTLQHQLGEAQTSLHAKEEECRKAAEERDRLAKNLVDQADQHKAAL